MDHQNSARDLATYDSGTDTTSIVNHRIYDAYGNLTPDADSTVDCVFGYTGRYKDSETGLQNNLNRWYDSTTGRWLSTDPSGFAAGDTNLYRYVGNNSTTYVDPSGEVVGAAAGAVTGAICGFFWYALSCVVTRQSMTTGGLYGSVAGGALAGGMIGAAATGDVISAGGIGFLAGAAGGGVGSWVQQEIDNGYADDRQVNNAMIIGGAFGALGGAGSAAISNGGRGGAAAISNGRGGAAPAGGGAGRDAGEAVATGGGSVANDLARGIFGGVAGGAGAGQGIIAANGGRPCRRNGGSEAPKGKKGGPNPGHTPGRGHTPKSGPQKTKQFQTKAANLRAAAQAKYEEALRRWEGMSEAARKLRPELNPENFRP